MMDHLVDERYMKRALALAERGRLYVSPNPMVGAVLVKDGRVIGEGYHRAFGKPHAEVEAIRDAVNRGESPAAATLYVTLEPCCHHGKTPPCTEAIVSAGIARVVCACADPNSLVNGKGFRSLESARVECCRGILDDETHRLNEKYFTYTSTGNPFVMVKIAATLDGKVASAVGLRTHITGEKSLRYVHRLRSEYDAIMVGSGTVLTDNPRLTCRQVKGGRLPIRVIVNTRGDLSPEFKVFDKTDGAGRILVTTKIITDAAVENFTSRGVKVVITGSNEGRVDLESTLKELGRSGISSVLAEAGPRLAGALFKHSLVNKACFCLAPMIFGSGSALPALDGVSFGLPGHLEAPHLTDIKISRFGHDVAVEGRVISQKVRTEKVEEIP
ncbi:MAG: bifunctional diaminohydroxyphosphoribosylaminopyrimidine deaminase/5-amino-6-(5-phosphoribosylamino)uracil reductase RibD [bacterium]|jgi:diaminohydroxyphosphoribosylaminopyrimidine deaminase/5-amino-6-(5-phosphoribosylamino)uracil reductase|nr:bifunctional diaminohydroxyphosphoribosylaminopyrimidine deaminase/5-amino-6-(5-phosphoribosylamino)uracil reductase RibD [bacterium]